VRGGEYRDGELRASKRRSLGFRVWDARALRNQCKTSHLFARHPTARALRNQCHLFVTLSVGTPLRTYSTASVRLMDYPLLGCSRIAFVARCGVLQQLRNVQRFRGGLVFKAHRLCASLKGSCLRLIDFVYHSTLGLGVMKKEEEAPARGDSVESGTTHTHTHSLSVYLFLSLSHTRGTNTLPGRGSRTWSSWPRAPSSSL